MSFLLQISCNRRKITGLPEKGTMKRSRSIYKAPWRAIGGGLFTIVLIAANANAGEWPYFVTYSHQMEEPGNLEIATRSVTGKPQGGKERVVGFISFRGDCASFHSHFQSGVPRQPYQG